MVGTCVPVVLRLLLQLCVELGDAEWVPVPVNVVDGTQDRDAVTRRLPVAESVRMGTGVAVGVGVPAMEGVTKMEVGRV